MRPKGLEPPAHCLEGSCSIHLSYGRTLLSHWVPLWRQLCVGTRCEKYNTIPVGFCQAKNENFFAFFRPGGPSGSQSSRMPDDAQRKTEQGTGDDIARTRCTPASTRSTQMSHGDSDHDAADRRVKSRATPCRQHGGAQRVAGGEGVAVGLLCAASGAKPGCSYGAGKVEPFAAAGCRPERRTPAREWRGRCAA